MVEGRLGIVVVVVTGAAVVVVVGRGAVVVVVAIGAVVAGAGGTVVAGAALGTVVGEAPAAGAVTGVAAAGGEVVAGVWPFGEETVVAGVDVEVVLRPARCRVVVEVSSPGVGGRGRLGGRAVVAVESVGGTLGAGPGGAGGAGGAAPAIEPISTSIDPPLASALSSLARYAGWRAPLAARDAAS